MKTVYVYLLNTMADWELGHITAELNTGRFFRKGAEEVQMIRVGATMEPVMSMGGMTVAPDCTVAEVTASENTVLLLPGADTWADPANALVVAKAQEVLAAGGTVAAICGATVALATAGMLNDRPHTSNGAGFLEMMSPEYSGSAHFVDAPAVADGNLITGGATGSLLWAKLILERMDVLSPDALDAWFAYFSTGDAAQFFHLMGLAGK